MIKKDEKIFLAGHKGMIGSAIYKKLKEKGYKKIITVEKRKLDLRNQNEVFDFIKTLGCESINLLIPNSELVDKFMVLINEIKNDFDLEECVKYHQDKITGNIFRVSCYWNYY